MPTSTFLTAEGWQNRPYYRGCITILEAVLDTPLEGMEGDVKPPLLTLVRARNKAPRKIKAAIVWEPQANMPTHVFLANALATASMPVLPRQLLDTSRWNKARLEMSMPAIALPPAARSRLPGRRSLRTTTTIHEHAHHKAHEGSKPHDMLRHVLMAPCRQVQSYVHGTPIIARKKLRGLS